MVIDLFTIFPFIYNIAAPFYNSGAIRVLRLLRIFRLHRLFSEEWRDLFGNMMQSQCRIANVAWTVFSILYVSAGLFYYAEVNENPEVTNFFDAYYFSTITLFTVGFGDVVPSTSLGRIVTVFTVLTGAVLIPIQLTEVQSVRSSSQQMRSNDMKMDQSQLSSSFNDIIPFDFSIECDKCHLRGHQKDARYCRSCAYPLRNQWSD